MISKPPIQSLDDLFASAAGYAKFSMHSAGCVPGTLLLLGPSGPAVFVPPSLEDEQDQYNFAAAARRLAIAHDASAVVMVLEAWVSVATPDTPLDPMTRPSEAPNRQEAVVLMGEAPGIQQTRFLPIQRTAAGAFAGFGETQVMCCDQVQGRFAQILPAQPPTADERLHAMATLRAMGIRSGPAPTATATQKRRGHRV
jgi:hypothetical protein